MRTGLRIAAVVISLWTMSMGAFAQGTPAAGSPVNSGPVLNARNLQRLSQQLHLSSTQISQAQALIQTQRQQAAALRKNSSLTSDQRRTQYAQLRESTHQQFLAILTPDQKTAFQQETGRRSSEGLGPLSAVNLTADQKAQIRPLVASEHQQIKAVQQDSSLDQQQKISKIRQIRLQTRSQVESLLTAKQLQDLQQLRGRQSTRKPLATPPPNL